MTHKYFSSLEFFSKLEKMETAAEKRKKKREEKMNEYLFSVK